MRRSSKCRRKLMLKWLLELIKIHSLGKLGPPDKLGVKRT